MLGPTATAELSAHFERLRVQKDLSRHLNDPQPRAEANSVVTCASSYIEAVDVLVRAGSSRQQFHYLFYHYAQSRGDGITRTELLTLLQENLGPAAVEADPRLFEKVYTYLKRHFTAPALSLASVVALLDARPTMATIDSVVIDVDKLVPLLAANNARNTVSCLWE
ncbi:hypothetical protein ACHHYP_06131 [Achlya hypogyna]|uniref:Uncharacterized protein n=1 Tax=Achlya hypogyna TaxID=1202772 RepID=A0A1V9YVB3_ACHHY|nr:hypothetical protein ACHHYP_06131 [Achlya hypogyna]